MASSQSQGIQTLLEAEKEAANIVQEARKYRVQRLRDARSEAQKEIDEYRQSKEAEFASIESGKQSLIDGAQLQADKETEAKLAIVKESFAKNREAVVQKLLDRVILVEPKLHRNLRKEQ
ncbi:H+-ATPase G subunit-domain-containing protein [Cantharellus anzutake]|uniref:H+-ATPase G subunit-domain-containing protein n=1 Tax=Cantharellus anzutake TaxID=1750568 RepID=UPI001907A867|nr:H+-ATPase G subunit-domain-containing protein [Cantharellus anzutake]KAF8329526.1 H+-ATPase G subunit-domain-containing protein [Cantharellus anzutake]